MRHWLLRETEMGGIPKAIQLLSMEAQGGGKGAAGEDPWLVLGGGGRVEKRSSPLALSCRWQSCK
jgi:hypothetical protein